MGLTVYGMKACPDCVEAVEELDGKGIGYVYKEFSEIGRAHV